MVTLNDMSLARKYVIKIVSVPGVASTLLDQEGCAL